MWKYLIRRRCGYFEGRLLLTLCRAGVDKQRLSATFLSFSFTSHLPHTKSIYLLIHLAKSVASDHRKIISIRSTYTLDLIPTSHP